MGKKSTKQETFQEIARDLPLEVLLNIVGTTSPFGARFTLWRSAAGHVLLKLKRPIPKREQWLFSNDRALQAVRQGLTESAAGAVITTRREPQVLATIGSLPNTGVFDLCCEPPENLVAALHAATGPTPYWSESLLAIRWESEGLRGCACPTLTNRERIVLSVIGDGRHDASAAEVLGLSTYTVQSARRSIYRKLGIDNKGELVRRAAETGFVLIGAGGVVRPGFSQLANAHLQGRAKIACGDLYVRENALAP